MVFPPPNYRPTDYVQSVASDIHTSEEARNEMKKLLEDLKAIKAVLIMTHDEFIVEAPEESKDKADEILRDYLEKRAKRELAKIGPPPHKFDPKISPYEGMTWDEIQKSRK